MNTHEDFRKVIREERENLTRLSDYWNSQVKCNQSISKDDQGRIRAAVGHTRSGNCRKPISQSSKKIGKTRLLLAEKFKQFEGLIEQSENNTAEKEISINDLQGFWDLVLIQVNEIKEMFRSLNSTGEKNSAEMRKAAKPKSPQDQKDVSKIKSFSKKKYTNDYIDQTERKLRDISEKRSGRTEARDLKNKLSLSKL